MFDLSPEKLLFLAVIAVMVLGPERLPKAARTFARVLHQVRSTTGSLQAEMAEALAEPRQAINDAVGDLGLHTDLRGMPKVPTARSLMTKALIAPVAATTRNLDASGAGADSVQASGSDPVRAGAAYPSHDLLPDDPSLN